MKKLKLLVAAFMVSLAFTACTDETDEPNVDVDPLAEYNLLTTLKANGHTLEVYSAQQQFTVGFNELFIRVKNDGEANYASSAELMWMPVMHMAEMSHSCPKSAISKTDIATVHKGYVVFQMPGNADEYWDLAIDYTLGGEAFKANQRIEVIAPTNGKRTVGSFMGSDNTRYIVAMAPLTPEVKVNDFAALVFRMENMMLFPAVENYKITIDPRMPGMGNHSSPNNEDLVYDAASKMYKGKLSLTMTGYWKINLKLLNPEGAVLKGEDVTEENEASSLFFEIEF